MSCVSHSHEHASNTRIVPCAENMSPMVTTLCLSCLHFSLPSWHSSSPKPLIQPTFFHVNINIRNTIFSFRTRKRPMCHRFKSSFRLPVPQSIIVPDKRGPANFTRDVQGPSRTRRQKDLGTLETDRYLSLFFDGYHDTLCKS